jgi:protein-S-isoprenylcysteine O-methyltransferase Ste14
MTHATQNTFLGNKHDRSGMVHFILLHSYVMFLIAVVLGLTCDVFITYKIFSPVYQNVGAFMIIAGSALIYWAQETSSTTRKKTINKVMEASDFERGPYRYSRNPTHIGLTVMTLGLAFVVNSFFTIIFVIIASFIAKFIFLRKEESVLEKRYGAPYTHYKEKVSTWV